MLTLSDWIAGLPGPVVRAWIWLRSWVHPPATRFDSEFIDATAWAEQYQPAGRDDVFERVSRFAENQYSFMIALSDGLDKKADEQVRFMVTLFGIVTGAVAGKLIRFERPWLAAAALVPIGVAILAAVRVRTPQSSATPLSPRDLLAVADLESGPTRPQVEAVIAASFHVAILGMRSLTTWKSRLLNRSIWAFVAGFALLLASTIPS